MVNNRVVIYLYFIEYTQINILINKLFNLKKVTLGGNECIYFKNIVTLTVN